MIFLFTLWKVFVYDWLDKKIVFINRFFTYINKFEIHFRKIFQEISFFIFLSIIYRWIKENCEFKNSFDSQKILFQHYRSFLKNSRKKNYWYISDIFIPINYYKEKKKKIDFGITYHDKSFIIKAY